MRDDNTGQLVETQCAKAVELFTPHLVNKRSVGHEKCCWLRTGNVPHARLRPMQMQLPFTYYDVRVRADSFVESPYTTRFC